MLRQACPEHRRRAQPERGVQLQEFFRSPWAWRRATTMNSPQRETL